MGKKNSFNFETCNPIYINLKLDVAPPRQSASHLLEKKREKRKKRKGVHRNGAKAATSLAEDICFSFCQTIVKSETAARRHLVMSVAQ